MATVKTPKVIVTDHIFSDLAIELAILGDLGIEVQLAESTSEGDLVRAMGSADAVLVCFAEIGPTAIEAAAKNGCKVIARYGIGVDNIDMNAAEKFGVRVTNVSDYCLDEVADHTMALILDAARRVTSTAVAVRNGEWRVPHGQVHRISGRRLALLGVGRIGKRVVARALPFGIDVVGYDPFLSEPIDGLVMVDSPVAAVREADFVSIHAPLTEETRHLVDHDLFAEMKRAPILINTSRGALIDLDAASSALDDGQISGLAVDVAPVEPLPADHPIRSAPNTIVTPHMAFYSVESERELRELAIDEVVRALRGDAARSEVLISSSTRRPRNSR